MKSIQRTSKDESTEIEKLTKFCEQYPDLLINGKPQEIHMLSTLLKMHFSNKPIDNWNSTMLRHAKNVADYFNLINDSQHSHLLELSERYSVQIQIAEKALNQEMVKSWLSMQLWSFDEAFFLLSGYDPNQLSFGVTDGTYWNTPTVSYQYPFDEYIRFSNGPYFELHMYHPIFSQYSEANSMAKRAEDAGTLKNIDTPANFLNFWKKSSFKIPDLFSLSSKHENSANAEVVLGATLQYLMGVAQILKEKKIPECADLIKKNGEPNIDKIQKAISVHLSNVDGAIFQGFKERKCSSILTNAIEKHRKLINS